MAKATKQIRVFLCYEHQDVELALKLFDFLKARGIEPWMDKRSLILGDNWEHEIRKAVAAADAVVVCFRPSFNKPGYRQQEVRWAIDAWHQRPQETGFIVPFIVVPCKLPPWAMSFHAGSFSVRTRFIDVLDALEKHCDWRRPPPTEWSRNDMGVRLTALVDLPTRRSAFYVAIGEGDFVRSWLSRIFSMPVSSHRPAISKIVILGLGVSEARRLERRGRLRQGFTQTMVQNVKAIQTDPEITKRRIPVVWKTWVSEAAFHGYLYRGSVLSNEWQINKLGHLHVMTPVIEMHRDDNPSKYASILRTFKTAPLQS